jgi:two-component system response regulator FixJ
MPPSASRSRGLPPRERQLAIERTIHIVDDDAVVRRSLERLLRAAGFATVPYDTPFAFLAATPSLSGGCVLLDVMMPGMDGLQLHTRLQTLGVRLPVIVITGEGDIQTAVRAMKAGAFDFIEKPFGGDRIIAAIEAALAESGRADRAQEAEAAGRRIAALTPREREVLDGLVAGKPNKTIAADLEISARTVEVHRARMLERLGTRRLADAIRLAVVASLGPGTKTQEN